MGQKKKEKRFKKDEHKWGPHGFNNDDSIFILVENKALSTWLLLFYLICFKA